MFYRILFSVLFFIIINSCEENSLSNEIVPPAPEPIVEIETPKTGKIVSEIVYIKAKTRDKDGIKGIDFFIDDSLFFSDLERPYRYGWNTIKYQENTEQTRKTCVFGMYRAALGHCTMGPSGCVCTRVRARVYV